MRIKSVGWCLQVVANNLTIHAVRVLEGSDDFWGSAGADKCGVCGAAGGGNLKYLRETYDIAISVMLMPARYSSIHGK